MDVDDGEVVGNGDKGGRDCGGVLMTSFEK